MLLHLDFHFVNSKFWLTFDAVVNRQGGRVRTFSIKFELNKYNGFRVTR
jgi:hypothetical protein